MKVKIRISKRFNLMVTITACLAALVMMVQRFDYSVDKLLQSLWIVLLLLLAVVFVAALLGGLLYVLSSRKNSDMTSRNETRDRTHHD